MSLPRKHFQALADIIRDEAEHATKNCPPGLYRDGRLDASDTLKHALADFCSQHNPNFDLARFLAACEPSATQHNATPKE